MNIITRKIYKQTGEYVSRCGITDKKSIVLINELVGGLYSKNLMKDVVDIFIFGDRFNKQDQSVVESFLNYGGESGSKNGTLNWTEEGIETDDTSYIVFDNFSYSNPGCFGLWKSTGPDPASSASSNQISIWSNKTTRNYPYRFWRFGAADTGSGGNCLFQALSDRLDGLTDYRHISNVYDYTQFVNLFTFAMSDFSYGAADPTTVPVYLTNDNQDVSVTNQFSNNQAGWTATVFGSNTGDASGIHTFYIFFKTSRKIDNHWIFLKELTRDTIARDLTGIVV